MMENDEKLLGIKLINEENFCDLMKIKKIKISKCNMFK